MNTSGVEHDDIYDKFFPNNIDNTKNLLKNINGNDEIVETAEMIAAEYTFDVWYKLIQNKCYTPHSRIYDFFRYLDDIFLYLHVPISNIRNENETIKNIIEWIDASIKFMPGGKCFAKLDNVSTKKGKPYYNCESILEDFYKTSRTFNSLTYNSKIVIREWVEFDYEFRCFIHDGTFRAISCEDKNIILPYINEIKKTISDIVFYTDYDACTIDLAIYKNKIFLVEINTPVYLFASSGNFDLSSNYDRNVLIGDYIPEYLKYPVIRDSKNEGLYS
jgi:hypothetical protein